MSRTFLVAVLSSCLMALGLLARGEEKPRDRKLTWEEVTRKAEWKPRDSCGEMAFKGRLWLIGGWYQSFEDPPRDVWSSADGKSWKLETKAAPFTHTDLPMTLTFKDRMWIMGGWHGGRLKHASASNQVWSSADGVAWKQETKAAGWSPRIAAAAVEFKGKMWILGGVQKYYFGNQDDLKSDVWSSEDGVTWKQATTKAPWAPRAYHAAVALNGKLYVYGGGNYLPKYEAHNDVWSSEDGVKWERVTGKAAWSGRIWFSGAVYRDRMWVLGGWDGPVSKKNLNDVWHSKDGKTWTRLETANHFPPRHEHSAYVMQDSLWVAGGMCPPLLNDTWKLHVPRDWFASAS